MVETTQVQDVLRSWGWAAPAWSRSAEYTLGFRVAPARFYRTVAQRLLARGDWRPTAQLVRTSETFKRPGELRHKATYATDERFDLLLLGREPICTEVEGVLRDPGCAGRRRASNTLQMFQALTHKDRLTQHLRAYGREAGVDIDAFLPLSFLVAPRSGHDEQAHEREEDQRDELLRTDQGLRASDAEPVVWIAKEAFGCRGRGTLVSDRIEQVLAHVDAQYVGDRSPCWVVQRYIHRPLLLHGHKFDIRVWVAIDPSLRVYAYQPFSGRIASEPYRLIDLDNRFVHLTNPFVQRHHPSFGSLAHGNELLPDEFAAQLQGVDPSIELERDIAAPMHAIILQTIAAVLRSSPASYDGFQILGYDFMFDAELRCHLLEINFSPSAGRLLERLAEDFIEVAIDPLFPRTHARTGDRENAFIRIGV
jgi:hypothetical protein